MKGKRKQTYRVDYTDNYSIWITTLFLTAYGLIMVFSAASTYYVDDAMHLFQRQLFFACLGLGACLVCQLFDYRILYRWAPQIYAVGIGLIFLLLTSFGVSAKGATRWLNIAGIQFQVAEVVKISVIVMLAYLIERCAKKQNKMQLLFVLWAMGGGAAVLLFAISNDLSSSLVILGITFGISFVYTRKEKFHLMALGTALGLAGAYVFSIWRDMPNASELEAASFRVGRIAAWLSPESYPTTQGYQTLQSLYAIGSGGLWGKGLGGSLQKLRAIPEAQNDMIFSIICEELGLIGATVLISLFVYLCWLIYATAISAKDLFGAVLATGVCLHIGLQTFINIGVNLNFLPNTGIGLPFISYGGTALFCQLAEIAIVLSIGRDASKGGKL